MARVFLSYSRQDTATAEQLAASLTQLGHELWWDRSLRGGARFASEIEAALARAEAVVVLWSASSLKSAWVQDEAAEGRDSGRLVPVTIDSSQPPLGFRQFHAIDYRRRDGKAGKAGLEAIDSAIRALAGSEPGEPPAKPVAGKRRARWPAALGGALGLAAVGAALFLWQGDRGGPSRLTVAEFAALSPGVPEAAPEALAEEMLTALGTDARVVASKAAAGASPSEGFVASGSLRTSGNMLRFTVHLSDAASTRQYWSASFERPLAQADLAPRQVGIAAAMVMRCGLTGRASHRGKLADEALAAYLNYCAEYWAETGGREMSATRGLDFAREAVAFEPGFSRGWSAVARMAGWAMRDAARGAAEAFRREAGEAARKSLSIDDRNSQAYEVLAQLEPRNSIARERFHAKSVSVQPGDCGCEHVGYGGFLAGVGRLTESLAQYQRARDMVPTSVSVNASLAEGLFALGRVDEAAKLSGPVLEIWPTDRQMHDMLVRTAFWTRRLDPALNSLANPATHFTSEERDAYAAALRAVGGGQGPRRAAAARLVQLAGQPAARRALLVTALAALGAEREAMAVASQLMGAAGSPEQFVLFEPPLAQARRSAEFAALAQRIGLVRYWRESGKPPEFCSAANPPALCGRLR